MGPVIVHGAGRLLYADAEFCELAGVGSPAESVDRPLDEFVPDPYLDRLAEQALVNRFQLSQTSLAERQRGQKSTRRQPPNGTTDRRPWTRGGPASEHRERAGPRESID